MILRNAVNISAGLLIVTALMLVTWATMTVPLP